MANIPTGRFVWFEYSSPDASRAQGFFGELFGWRTKKIEAAGNEYTMIVVGDDTIGGYWPAAPAGAPQGATWISHLQVESAKESAAKVKQLGGQVIMEPMTVGEHGTFAVVKDPTGAVFSLWQPDQMKGNPDFKGAPNTFCWNELLTPDPDRAISFYKALSGFDEDKMEMEEGGTYHILKRDGKGRAGVMKTPMADSPTAWMPYVHVSNVDDTAKRATKLGAKLVVSPKDIPNIGRFAVIVDPQGAPLGVLQPAPAQT